MVGWHHRLNGHEFQETLGDSEGQGSLECCSPWGRKASDTEPQKSFTAGWFGSSSSQPTVLTASPTRMNFILLKHCPPPKRVRQLITRGVGIRTLVFFQLLDV